MYEQLKTMTEIGTKQHATLCPLESLSARWQDVLRPVHEKHRDGSSVTFRNGEIAFMDYLRTGGMRNGLYLAMLAGIARPVDVIDAYKRRVLELEQDRLPQIYAMGDGQAFLASWYAYMDDFLRLTSKILTDLEDIIASEKLLYDTPDMEADPSVKSLKGVKQAIESLISTFRPVRRVFVDNITVRGTWEEAIVGCQIAKLANAVAVTKCLSQEEYLRHSDIGLVIESLRMLSDPIDHIKTVYVDGYWTEQWVIVDLVKSSPKPVTFQNGTVLHRMIDEIIYKAGMSFLSSAQAPHEINFKFIGNKIVITDASKRGAFATFEQGRPEREQLISLAGKLGDGGSIDFITCEGAAAISAINITVPVMGPTAGPLAV